MTTLVAMLSKTVFEFYRILCYIFLTFLFKLEFFQMNLKLRVLLLYLKEVKIGNYRPISVLPCFSKILERIMYNRFYKYLTGNNILYKKQFGFQTRHSMEHAKIQLVDQINNHFEKDQYRCLYQHS